MPDIYDSFENSDIHPSSFGCHTINIDFQVLGRQLAYRKNPQ